MGEMGEQKFPDNASNATTEIRAELVPFPKPDHDTMEVGECDIDAEVRLDPLVLEPSPVAREGDFVILAFGDGRQIFAQCLSKWRGKNPPVKINKKTYPTVNLIGQPYGTVLELGRGGLHPLPDGEDVVPETSLPLMDPTMSTYESTEVALINGDGSTDPEDTLADLTETSHSAHELVGISQKNDNRDLLDNNSSQSLKQRQLEQMREDGIEGSAIVATLVENSATFDAKTDFSKAKYIARKQMKYQPRCRMVRCTGASICEALFLKEPRKMMNLREDSLAQILSYSNVCAGSKVMVFDSCMGVITGALAQRMGGYGMILSLYTGQQPSYTDMITRFNLSFGENYSIKWLHAGEVFANDMGVLPAAPGVEEVDYELNDRNQLQWPCTLQPHTRQYLESMSTDKERTDFLAKRSARFARKLTRHTVLEASRWAHDSDRLCCSLIVASKYDPTSTLLTLLPFVAPSCPFVVFYEFLEPLADCFRAVQKLGVAINLRLTDTWMREYQMLPGRTHPFMNMSQNGGFLLTGIKLCPITGKNELDENVLKELRAKIGGRRGKKQKKPNLENSSKNSCGRKETGLEQDGREAKRSKLENKVSKEGKGVGCN